MQADHWRPMVIRQDGRQWSFVVRVSLCCEDVLTSALGSISGQLSLSIGSQCLR